jgi:cyclophilin family peptidyl-prolyl cis-trans isomerase
MLKKCILIALTLLTLNATTYAKKPIVELKTTMGSIIIELNHDKAPISVENFLRYTKSGFYDNTIFHRVIKDFMIQGGGFEQLPHKKETFKPIRNEATNGLKNIRGTIAMARTREVHSGTAQFFINVVDNHFLDHKGRHPRQFGYAVFGRVIKGMKTVDKISKTQTKTISNYANVPEKEIKIITATVLRDLPKKEDKKQ